VNLGFGGGFAGFGGGQLGQFGNLGGQFGLQGGDQSTILISTIMQVVGTPRDWAPPGLFQQAQLPQIPGAPQPQDLGQNPEGNSLGFYPPAMALVVKGTSRIHTRYNSPIAAPGAVPPVAPLLRNDGKERDALARNDQKPNVPINQQLNNRVAAGAGQPPDARKQPDAKPEPKAAVAKAAPDPRTVWEETLAKAAVEPGLVIATADFLMEDGRPEHAAEFLKANLRRGIVVRPWVYEALAIALKESKASPEEIERAELAAADLEPQDAQAMLQSAQAMADNKRYDRAVAFCRQAASLEPNAAAPFAEALLYAELGQDAEAMEWAAGNLMRQEWPNNNDDLQKKAKAKLTALAKVLAEKSRKQEAERLLSSMDKQRERDLVIRLKWRGEADLDLRVLEPTGSTCSPLNRQSVGGGTLIGDVTTAQAEEEKYENYLAAEAFPGEYQITVERVWGRPLGDKAQIEVISHLGTAREKRGLYTVDLRAGNTLLIKLEEGRRNSAAYVPPPAMQRADRPSVQAEASGVSIMTKLRDLASPLDMGMEPGIRGGVGRAGLVAEPRELDRSAESSRNGEQVAHQTKVAQFAGNTGADLTSQAVVSADRRYVRLSLNAAFNTVTGVRTTPIVNTSVVPGFASVPRP
jgi:tetratricopeptide (TPR) repeat protein